MLSGQRAVRGQRCLEPVEWTHLYTIFSSSGNTAASQGNSRNHKRLAIHLGIAVSSE